MKKQKQFEKWANEKLTEYQNILGLNNYYLYKIEFIEGNSSKCIFRYPYKDILIQYCKDVYSNWEKGDLQIPARILLHEMVHVITDELYSKSTDRYVSRNEIEDAREAVTDHIANIIFKTLHQQ
jgi:hypothetical protein